MRTLGESIFSDINDIVNNDSALIEQFLKDNYHISGTYSIDGKDVVDVNGTMWLTNTDAEAITNGLFRFGKVSGGFSCFLCHRVHLL